MKPLLIISLLTTLGTGVLAFMNRTKFIDARTAKDENTRLTLAGLDDTKKLIDGDINPTIVSWQGEKKRFHTDTFNRDSQKKEMASREKETGEVTTTTQTTQKEIDAMVTTFNEALKDFGVSRPEELGEKRDALKADVNAQNEMISKHDKEIAVLEGILAENTKQIGRMSDLQTQRSKTIALGSREGTVTAVNPDWGFVIVNMGKGAGVTNESKLLVRRGQQLIGRLKITQITETVTVADIDAKSIKPGSSIQPGDQVIFDTVN